MHGVLLYNYKVETYFDVNPGISIPGQGESSELLNDGDKSDYDRLLAPRDTPMFPSLDDEPSMTSFGSRGRPQSKPIAISRSSTMDKSHEAVGRYKSESFKSIPSIENKHLDCNHGKAKFPL
ncbi:hypothetical protein ACSQ67_025269 [Phaseolus vulgaris]